MVRLATLFIFIISFLFLYSILSKRSAIRGCDYEIAKLYFTTYKEVDISLIGNKVELFDKCMLAQGYVFDQGKADESPNKNKEADIFLYAKRLNYENWANYYTAKLFWEDKNKPSL